MQIANTSDEVASLQGWQIIAPNEVGFELADMILEPGEIFKFILPTNDGILRNKAGTIEMKTPSGEIAQSFPYTTQQAKQEGQPILIQ